MQRIIRFEKDGMGMYSASDVAKEHMNKADVHCSPRDDDVLWEGLEAHWKESGSWEIVDAYMSHFFFGFATKRQARRWVYRKRWLEAMHKEGIQVSEYFCLDEDVVIGSTQAIFCEHHHKVVYEIPKYFKLNKA